MTQSFTRAGTREWQSAFSAAIRMPMLGALLLVTLPATAHGQTLNTNSQRLAQPITTTQPNLRLTNPTRIVTPVITQSPVPSTTRIAPSLAPGALPALRPARTAPVTTGPSLSPTIVSPAAPVTAATTGLGRLVAPGTENSSVVVARIGSTARADMSRLTVDFDGDGLINFEIAPGIVDVPAETMERGGDALGGLVGQHVTMATDTADRVLDTVINVEGVVAATTFEITDGVVVLGGVEPTAVAGLVDDLATPNGPEPGVPSHDPKGTQGHEPDDPAGGHGDPDGRDPGGNDPTSSDDVVICLSHGCYGEPPDPKPEDGPAANTGPTGDDGPVQNPIFQFTSFRTPPEPESGTESAPDDLVNVSIMLPLRGREPEGDQFSNYGNEEIW